MKPWGIFTPAVEVYTARTALPRPHDPPILSQLQTLANARCFPITGPAVGRVLRQAALLRQPSRVLDLGSGFGYSALWLALGAPQAEIHLVDRSSNLLDEAMAHATALGCAHRFQPHPGDALAVAESLPGPWDLIFCDIDKPEYPAVVDLAERTLAPGGVLILDDALWHGNVAAPDPEQGPAAEAIRAVTERLYADSRWACSLLPVHDGLLMAIRLTPEDDHA